MKIENYKKICVVGWGKSGMALCRLLLSLKKKVFVSEAREKNLFDSFSVDELFKEGVIFEFGGHSHNFIKDCQLLVLSPGVELANCPIIRSANSLGIPYVGEIEFSSWLTEAKIVAITGTNGKSTTSYLIYEVLKKRRKRVFLGGNIGTPFSSFVVNTKKDDIIVLELSSFQLETILKFKPFLAALLNIEPDHLDRYNNFSQYLEAKLNIFKNQSSQDWALINKNIDFRAQIEKKVKSKIIHFSNELLNSNFSCVYKCAYVFGASKLDCLKVFSSFEGLPHRLQLVKKIKGVSFVNDSKATNPASTIWALKNIKAPIILLAGGKDKGLEYSSISPFLRKVKKVNLFGEAASKIKNALDSNTESQSFFSLEEAVKSSFEEATSGDTILLSPMCSSFDMFSDYAQRGNIFVEIVKGLSV